MSRPIAPHQDPSPQQDPTRVSIMEYVTTLIAQLDRRLDSLIMDLRNSMLQRFEASNQRLEDADCRYQQRFNDQTKALDAALAAQKEAVQTALVAAEKATSKAETTADKRFQSVDEFRQTLSDQTASFITRNEAAARMDALDTQIGDLKTAMAAGTGRSAGFNAGWSYLIAAAGIALGVVSMIISR